ncbi:MaoC family dehydratase [Actinomadura viridis]|uniref:MaoC family dehydratase n=1 Tax=Actinomadura viridis TaxID=58110 RepID=UPI0036CAA23B
MPDGVSEILRFAEAWGRRAYPVRWSLRDTITYAIATGADGRNGRALVWESAPGFGTLPTFATRFAHQALIDLAAGTRHAGLPFFARASRVRLHGPLPSECDEARASAALGVKERSAGRLVLTLDVETRVLEEPIAHSSLDVHFRLPGERRTRRASPDAEDTEDAEAADGARTVEVAESVRPYQAAVFRTLLGLRADGRVQDAMHIDPVRARELGLPAPALPGEITLGILARLAAENRERLGVGGLSGVEARYLRPVWDLDELAITFVPARDGSVLTKVVNGEGRTAVAGALHFQEAS